MSAEGQKFEVFPTPKPGEGEFQFLLPFGGLPGGSLGQTVPEP